MRILINKFWKWYNQHLLLTTGVAAGLFVLQLVHLYWLTTHVVIHRLIGISIWNPTPLLELLLITVDYTEIPALIATSLVYINEYRQKKSFKSLLYLFFLNIQFVHIFWITDEFVVEQFTGAAQTSQLPGWLAWIAILIDYLELPVIFETFKKLFESVKKKDLEKLSAVLRER